MRQVVETKFDWQFIFLSVSGLAKYKVCKSKHLINNNEVNTYHSNNSIAEIFRLSKTTESSDAGVKKLFM